MRLPKWLTRSKSNTVNAGGGVILEPTPEDYTGLTNGWNLEMAIPPRMLAALYLTQGWPIAVNGQLGYPTAAGLIQFITDQVEHLDYHEDVFCHTLGRLMVIRDEDFPDSIDIYLHVGIATRPNDVEAITVD